MRNVNYLNLFDTSYAAQEITAIVPTSIPKAMAVPQALMIPTAR